jgi:nitroimidazol reductase NimA-like FMN-containing flavoprotein (pyridoxamine 5'-phosphate oxidase superfamily)
MGVLAMNAVAPFARTATEAVSARGFDRQALYAVLDAGLLAHVGLVIDGRPQVTPVSYCRRGDWLYWHGAIDARSVAACVTVTKLDGIVLGRASSQSVLRCRSVTCFGRAVAVADAAEKARALEAMVERLTPGRAAELPPLQMDELRRTPLLGMRIEDARVNARDDAQDAAADDTAPVWAGVVPVRLTAGEPIPDTSLGAAIMLPDSVAGMVAALKHPPRGIPS